MLQYESFFEALPPKFNSQLGLIFYPHPILKAEANELGEVRSTDPDFYFGGWDFWNYELRSHLTRQCKGKYLKTRFLAQCYFSLQRPSEIFYLDGNPYNTSKSNLISKKFSPPGLVLEGMLNTQTFIRNTIDKIPEVYARYEKHGWTLQDFFINLKIPQNYQEYFFNRNLMEENFTIQTRTVDKIQKKQKTF